MHKVKGMKKRILALFLFVAAFAGLAAENISSKILGDSSTLTYLGDSITHGGRYNKYITAYYITRFPSMKVNFVSKGISGDTAEGILKRMESDVLNPKPDAIILMIGMNDSARDIFSTERPNPPEKIAKVRKYVIDYYKYNLNRMLKEFNEAGIGRVVVFTPSIYDETTTGSKQKPLTGANGVLREFGNIVEQTAPKYGAKVADIWGQTNQLNCELQKADKSATVISADRVHPQNPGGFAIAAKYIADTGESPVVSETEIDFSSGKTLREANCSISDISKTGSALKFKSLEYSLPIPVSAELKKIAELIDFNNTFNRQILSVKNLNPGKKYALKIDSQPVGEYSARELSDGVNLAGNALTPQYKQAEEVLSLCEQWRDKYSKFRNFAYVELKHIKDPQICADPAKAVEYVRTNFPEDKRFKGSAYYKGVHEFYCANRMDKDKLSAEIKDLIKRAYEAAQPKPHAFEICEVSAR